MDANPKVKGEESANRSETTPVSLTESQLQSCEECFNFFDKDKSGSIDRMEIASAMRTFGLNPTEAEISQVIDYYAKKGNEEIDFNEFKHLIQKTWKSEEQTRFEMVASFSLFDKNKDGFVCVDDLCKILTSSGEPMTPEEAEHFIRIADADKDGKLNYQEFVKVLCD